MKYYTPTKLSENIHETPEGFILCVGVSIARTGEMEYAEGETPLEGKNGRVVISRDEADVFRLETIASFEGKPVTILHPQDFVTPENWKDLAKGVVQNVRRGEGDQEKDLIADLLITDSVAIALVKNGLREVSCGYEAEYTQTGEGRGTQTNIIGNHLALVEQGRAGSSYAINDTKQKGVFSMAKISEKLKALFAKTADEAAKVLDEEMKDEDKPEEKAKDAGAYDELIKMCDDLKAKAMAMSAPKDEKKPEEEKPAVDEDKPEEKAKDDDVMEKSIEERLKALELAVSKMSGAEAGDEDKEESEDELEVSDEDKEDKSEDDMPEMTGDTAARVEILAPGLKATKDVKAKALKAALDTAEGKKAIYAITGGKAPAFDSAEKVDTLFVAASEVLKISRSKSLASTKTSDFLSNIGERAGAMTPERMNEINAKHFGIK